MIVSGGNVVGGHTSSHSLTPFDELAHRQWIISPSGSPTEIVRIVDSLTMIWIGDIIVATGTLLYRPLSNLDVKLIGVDKLRHVKSWKAMEKSSPGYKETIFKRCPTVV